MAEKWESCAVHAEEEPVAAAIDGWRTLLCTRMDVRGR